MLCFLITQQIYALCDISGRVVNIDKDPVSFANVLLLQEDSTLIKGNITNEDGFFLIEEVAEGPYRLAVSMLGYKTIYLELYVPADEPSIDLDAIRLAEESIQLLEVEVRSKKPIFVQKMDRLVINVENSITNSSGSVLEVLEKSPGVRINRQSNSIALNGKDGVVMMINGKERQMPLDAALQMLQGMPASQVEKIELITTPPAKYDAQGNGGLINIVLKKGEDEGTNGTLSLNGGYGAYEKYGGSILFNHRSGNINLFGNYAYSFDHNFEFVFNARSIRFDNLKTAISSAPNWEVFKTNHQASLGIDIALNQNTILGAQVSSYDDLWSNGDDAFNAISITENDVPTAVMKLYNRERRHWQNITGNLNLEQRVNKKQNLSINLDYLYYQNTNPTDLFNEITDLRINQMEQEQLRVRKETPLGIWVVKTDHTLKIGESFRLETGLKNTFSKFENDIQVQKKRIDEWESNPNFTQRSTLQENILAAYSSFQYDIEGKTTLSGGLRYEFTTFNITTQGELSKLRYGNFFPTLYFSHQINEKHAIQLAYNRRINRPSFNDLAPKIVLLDPYTVITGNASLQPSISNTFKADYNYKSFLLSISYSIDDGAIVTYQPRVKPEDNTLAYAAQNLDYLKTWNALFSIPFYLNNWWEIQNNCALLWQNLKTGGENPPIKVHQFNVSFSTVHNFKLPDNFSLELSGNYQSQSLWGYMRMQPIGSVNAGIQKVFADNSKLKLSCNDIFDTYNWEFITDIPDQNLDTTFAVNFESLKFMLTYSRNFGSRQLKSARQRDTGSAAERRRVGN